MIFIFFFPFRGLVDEFEAALFGLEFEGLLGRIVTSEDADFGDRVVLLVGRHDKAAIDITRSPVTSGAAITNVERFRVAFFIVRDDHHRGTFFGDCVEEIENADKPVSRVFVFVGAHELIAWIENHEVGLELFDASENRLSDSPALTAAVHEDQIVLRLGDGDLIAF